MVWESTDLVTWSGPRLGRVAPDNAGNAWAPEAFYDDTIGAYVVFWASKLYVVGASTADGAEIAQYACNGGANQQWQVQGEGSGYLRLVARHSGKCLDVTGWSTTDGARLEQWTCHGGANQQWQQNPALAGP